MYMSPNHPDYGRTQNQPPTQPAPEPSGRHLATFERKGRGRAPDTELRVVLDEYQGHPYISLRVWSRGQDGLWFPTRKGCSVRLGEAEDLADALGDAVRMANFTNDQAAKGSPRRDDRRPAPAPRAGRPPDRRPGATPPTRRTESPDAYDQDFDEFSE